MRSRRASGDRDSSPRCPSMLCLFIIKHGEVWNEIWEFSLIRDFSYHELSFHVLQVDNHLNTLASIGKSGATSDWMYLGESLQFKAMTGWQIFHQLQQWNKWPNQDSSWSCWIHGRTPASMVNGFSNIEPQKRLWWIAPKSAIRSFGHSGHDPVVRLSGLIYNHNAPRWPYLPRIFMDLLNLSLIVFFLPGSLGLLIVYWIGDWI